MSESEAPASDIRPPGSEIGEIFLTVPFTLNSILLGIGLAMDAFSVSLANGLSEPMMKKDKVLMIAGTFALFQALMPLLGWFSVQKMVSLFSALKPLIPWVSLILLIFIGSQMALAGFRGEKTVPAPVKLGLAALLIQGLATSVDALSVGFTIADYGASMAVLCASIIAGVTLLICMTGVVIGKKLGASLSGKAMILGGFVLIAVGIEIWLKGII